MSTNFTYILVTILILVFAAVLVRRNVNRKADTEHRLNEVRLQQQETDIRQKAVMKEMNLLGALIDDKSLTSSELEIKCKQSLATIESHNLDGILTGMLNDLTQHVMAEVESRRSRESK